MVLHPIKHPNSAALLLRVLVLQKRLLRALAEPALPAALDEAWLQQVWSDQRHEWVLMFCRGGKRSILQPLKVIAAAPQQARLALYNEFRRQNKRSEISDNAGMFKNLATLPGSNRDLAEAMAALFNRFYELLSHDAGRKWNGYEFGRRGSITNQIYHDDFCKAPPVSVLCPYCDGEIGTSQLDHYFPKSVFPLLECSPRNLVPVCASCNSVFKGKGNRVPITPGVPPATNDWLHPFFRPVSGKVYIQLTGKPKEPVPRLYSSDALEQVRLDNHARLIPSLGSRWANLVAAYYGRLVRGVRQRPDMTAETYIQTELKDHEDARGTSPSSMVYAAVCRAVLERRPGYFEELASPNAPQLS